MSSVNFSDPDPQLMAARQYLWEEQEKHARKSGAFNEGILPASNVEPALQSLQWRRQFEPTDIPGVVRRGLWKFDRQTEEKRVDRAEAIIRRTEPGPFEDPQYLALLAYQAASIEMSEGGDALWSNMLLGTIHSAKVNAYAQVFKEGGYAVVMIYSALIDLVYQAAKAVAAAGNPTRVHDGRSDIRSSLDPDAVRAQLKRDSEPVDRLYETLAAYFFNGYPRAYANEEVREENIPPLSMLVGMAERFIVGHEYGHKPAKRIHEHDDQLQNPKWAEEFFADRHGMFVNVWSGAILDQVNPEVALAGAVFSLACTDLLVRAFSILREGRDLPVEGSKDHPPAKMRARYVVNGFHEDFDVQYANGFRECDLALRDTPADIEAINPAVREHVRSGAYAYADALEIIWVDVRERLMKDYADQRPLHSMWT